MADRFGPMVAFSQPTKAEFSNRPIAANRHQWIRRAATLVASAAISAGVVGYIVTHKSKSVANRANEPQYKRVFTEVTFCWVPQWLYDSVGRSGTKESYFRAIRNGYERRCPSKGGLLCGRGLQLSGPDAS
jgi:hypothetical protein